jgi:hypothetical protein
MTITLDPGKIRDAWENGVVQGMSELDVSERYHADARGVDMGDLAECLGTAVDDLAGVTQTTRTVVNELGSNMELCLDMWENTGHTMDGTFKGLVP